LKAFENRVLRRIFGPRREDDEIGQHVALTGEMRDAYRN
jgi:hypothetical protein